MTSVNKRCYYFAWVKVGSKKYLEPAVPPRLIIKDSEECSAGTPSITTKIDFTGLVVYSDCNIMGW